MDETALFKLSYGLYIVSSTHEGKDAGCIANTLQQVTAFPVQIAITLNKDNETKNIIEKSQVFNAVVLSEDMDMEVIGTFGFHSSRDLQKFETVSYQRDAHGIPYINEHTSARVTCKVVNQLDIGTHVMFIGEVVECEHVSDEPVMTYSYYHKVKNGVTPKNASSYQEPSKKSGWRCTICGYVYEGDPLPADFICPICHYPASAFEKI